MDLLSRSNDGAFHTTHWSMVVAAGDSAASGVEVALSELCQRYWYPLYYFVRRRGYQASEAEDLTQEFFHRLFSKKLVQTADRERGKFRTFLLACLQNFLNNDYAKQTAQKRGGEEFPLSLDFEHAESIFQKEPSSNVTPEQEYERQWAINLLNNVLSQLRNHYEDTSQGELFGALQPYLTADSQTQPYEPLAGTLGLSVANVKVKVHRLRGRYRDLLRQEIAGTLVDPADIDAELQDLFKALGR